jgi:uncharacterized protein with HEPN domain
MSVDRSVAQFVQDMLESIEKIESYLVGVTPDEFSANSLLYDAVFRRLAIVGETAKHVPEEVRANYPDIPWQKIAGLRDVLIHRYFGIIVEQVWHVIAIDLPTVKPHLSQVHTDLDNAEWKDSL